MVDFEPNFTEVVFLDIEFYVPKADRIFTGESLLANPYKSFQFLLGGVFCRAFPLKNIDKKFASFWIWKENGNEKELLGKIYDYFKLSWDMLKGKSERNPDLVLVGLGISRFDLPVLFIRSLINEIDKPHELFKTYFKTKHVDLSNVGIPFFDTHHSPILYPKSVNQLMRRFKIGEIKKSGKTVWEMYDEKEYENIETRTKMEVQNTIKLYENMIKKISRGSLK